MISLDHFRATFFQECDELLASLELHLSELLPSPGSDKNPNEALAAAFRAIHSIKGGATMFRFKRIVDFAHGFETTLDLARNRQVPISRAFVDTVLRATDVLTDLTIATRNGHDLAVEFEAAAATALAALSGHVVVRPPLPAASVSSIDAAGQPSTLPSWAVTRTYVIEFEPKVDLLKRGIEPLVIIRNLRALGFLTVDCDTGRLPLIDALDPTACHLAWTFTLSTAADEQQIREVFEFTAGSAELTIRMQTPAVVAAARQPDPVETGAQFATGATGASTQAADAAPIPVERPLVDRRINSVRVDLDRVERLVDLVGEVTSTQAMVLAHLDTAMVEANPNLFRAVNRLLQLSGSLQDGVMAIRAQPIRTIFGRLPRVVRESASALGRDVKLETSGEHTELDKTIVEQLADPLMHIVRNSIDHGIEPPEERRALGKPECGLIHVSAAQRGGRILVEVRDDGRGIDRASVLRRALAMGLVDSPAGLADDAIERLIFSPGLSTARSISDISGRGVGMDVVMQNIQRLGGSVSIRSTPGRGTAIVVSLPLTLAVTQTLTARCGGETYLFPVTDIVECVSASRSELTQLPMGGSVVTIRSRHVPLIDLAQLFGLTGLRKRDRYQIVIVILGDNRQAGFLVDDFCGHQQIVVKSIRDHYADLEGIAGATILGDGRIALILDVNQLAHMAERQRAGVQLSHGPMELAS